ncbi:MAG TPA: hemolysin family protein [Rhodospirillales bacterium]|jgi:CBS domain containing-hemolysin-like protein|nr:hemolysin family protein [Rhodospirillales bacterium]|tara:strand:+ start:742 stop:1659 length:918 start_codon:yes stop_codon:yes gene_type:complete
MNDPADIKNARSNGTDGHSPPSGLGGWLKNIFRPKNGEGSARDVLEGLIEEREEAEVPIDDEERLLLANILELKGSTIHDVMVPRADIVSIECETGLSDVIDLITQEGHSRLPVFREALDDAIGMVHIKDVIAWRGEDSHFALSNIVRKVLYVPPSMQVLELLLEMRATRCHMALVVDEYGGVDGLVTIEDLVEEIVGEIEDEHDRTDEPIMVDGPGGTLIADARATIEMLEERLGGIVSDEEREDIDTLGGLVFFLAGRVPVRGELIAHPSGLEFEILDADPRRIRKLRLRGVETITTASNDEE